MGVGRWGGFGAWTDVGTACRLTHPATVLVLLLLMLPRWRRRCRCCRRKGQVDERSSRVSVSSNGLVERDDKIGCDETRRDQRK